MSRKSILLAAAVGLGFFLLWNGCEDDPNDNKRASVISSYGDTDSHHSGENCMSCHDGGGSGTGWFKVAGTIYQSDGITPYPNTTVSLYADAASGGDLEMTVEVDGNGNFYTTESVSWGIGLVATATSDSDTRTMSSRVTDGACNLCHGVAAAITLD
ncbi:hypothetical protein ACFL45_07945 [Candidatus Neomarinimicrobiota bacterium]